MMINKFPALVFTSIALIAGAFPKPGLAVQSAESASDQWFKGNKITLTTSDRAQRSSANLKLETGDNGDLMLEGESRQGGEVEKGTIIVVGGRAMLTRGLKLEKGYEIDGLDGPILVIQLALTLLSKAFPEGPRSVGQNSRIDLADNHLSLSIHTVSAGGDFQPPWTLKGTAGLSTDGVVQFEMSFTYSSAERPNKNETILFAGTWQLSPNRIVIADDFQLKDWQIYSLGATREDRADGATILDYGAGPMKRYATLGELRKAIGSDQKNPGSREADSRKETGRKTPKMSSNN